MSFIVCPICHQMLDERRTHCDVGTGGCGYTDPAPVEVLAEPETPAAGEPELTDAA